MATKRVCNKISSKNIAIVSGQSGSGKSAIIQHIALMYRTRNWVVIPVFRIEDIIKICDSRNHALNTILIIFNDPIGNEAFDDILYTEWHKNENKLLQFLKHGKLLMSCRKNILVDNRAGGIFQEKSSIIDIDERKLSPSEKKGMLKMHLTNECFSQITRYEWIQLFEIDQYFPLSCKRYAESISGFQGSVVDFFKNPRCIISRQIEDYKARNSIIYCALVCLVLFENKLSLDSLNNDNSRFQDCLSLSHLQNVSEIKPDTIIDELKLLEGLFVKRIGETFYFFHDLISEVTTSLFGNEYKEKTIKYADLSFLRKRMRLDTTKQNKMLSIPVSVKEYGDILCNRLLNGLLSDRFMEVVLNPCLKDKNVTDCLIQKIKGGCFENVRYILKTKQNIRNEEQMEIRKEENGIIMKKSGWIKEKLNSKINFVYRGRELSPLFVLIALGHDDLSLAFIDVLTRKQIDLKENKFICALCCNGSMDLYKEFYSKNVITTFMEEWDGLYPIHIASLFHNVELLDEMIKSDQDVNMRDKSTRLTPLSLAVCTEETEACIADHTNYDTKTSPADGSEKNRNRTTITLLLEKGALINTCRSDMKNPLVVACKNGYYDTVELFLQKGAEVNIFPVYRKSPLYAACKNGHQEIVQLLLDVGADVNSLSTGQVLSPLYVACKNGHEGVAEILLKNNADVNLGAKFIGTPLKAACIYGKESIVKLLLKYDADINLSLDQSSSPLYMANLMGFKDIIELLVKNNAIINITSSYVPSPLYAICKYGDKSLVKYLLKRGADINLCSGNGSSPLHAACEQNDYDITKLLLKNGASVNASAVLKGTPLCVACKNGCYKIAQFLIKRGAEVNAPKSNEGPLYLACINGHEEIVDLLITKKANVNLCTKYGKSPLYAACRTGNEEIVNLLLQNSSIVDLQEGNEETPLVAACSQGNVKIVNLLLQKQANVNFESGNGETPLLAACENGLKATVEILLENDADVNFFSEQMGYPLYVACSRGHMDIVDFLLDKTNDINICSEIIKSPLHAACEQGYETIVQLLLHKKANVNKCSKYRGSPLHGACENGNYEVIKSLLDKDADVNACSKYANSPLYVACELGIESVVNLLIEKGALINLCTEFLGSPLRVACEKGHFEIVKKLLDKDADVNLCSQNVQGLLRCERGYHFREEIPDSLQRVCLCLTQYGKTPLHSASKNGHDRIVDLLLAKDSKALNVCLELEGSPLHLASSEGFVSTVNILLNKMTEVDLKDTNTGTPLLQACRDGHDNVIKVLLEHGASVNLSIEMKKKIYCEKCTSDRYIRYKLSLAETPLIEACKRAHYSTIKLLLDNGAIVNTYSTNGETALSVAVGNKKIEELLRTYEKRPKVSDASVD